MLRANCSKKLSFLGTICLQHVHRKKMFSYINKTITQIKFVKSHRNWLSWWKTHQLMHSRIWGGACLHIRQTAVLINVQEHCVRVRAFLVISVADWILTVCTRLTCHLRRLLCRSSLVTPIRTRGRTTVYISTTVNRQWLVLLSSVLWQATVTCSACE